MVSSHVANASEDPCVSCRSMVTTSFTGIDNFIGTIVVVEEFTDCVDWASLEGLSISCGLRTCIGASGVIYVSNCSPFIGCMVPTDLLVFVFEDVGGWLDTISLLIAFVILFLTVDVENLGNDIFIVVAVVDTGVLRGSGC